MYQAECADTSFLVKRFMYVINKIQFKTDSKEEFLPGFSADFPYMASQAALDEYPEGLVPWHWHNALELFYVESGFVEYYTPGGIRRFEAGSGGLVNSNVLHMTKTTVKTKGNVQLIHLFDPVLISGGTGNLIDKKYVMPLITASHIELIGLFPDVPQQKAIIGRIRESFARNEKEDGYEIRLRQELSEIWLMILDLVKERIREKGVSTKSSDQIKKMMIYVQEHYEEKITVSQLAEAAFLSERACYRLFQSCLRMTPIDYMKSYRLQRACQMLAKEEKSLAQISRDCGLGTSSYFGKIFKETMGCTPLEYRKKWQNRDINMPD